MNRDELKSLACRSAKLTVEACKANGDTVAWEGETSITMRNKDGILYIIGKPAGCDP